MAAEPLAGAAKPPVLLLADGAAPCLLFALLPSGLLPLLPALLPRGVRLLVPPLLRGDLERGVDTFLPVGGVLWVDGEDILLHGPSGCVVVCVAPQTFGVWFARRARGGITVKPLVGT